MRRSKEKSRGGGRYYRQCPVQLVRGAKSLQAAKAGLQGSEFQKTKTEQKVTLGRTEAAF